ncbi:MAG: type III-B CRISPR module RAMP protein Cmr1, partial [Candidatus Bathyarchaeia archaeon]
MKRIATISLESIAPVSLGGYDTSTHRQIGYINLAEPFRLTSVKGIWRWWLRAYLAGAAWDEGLSEKEGAEESQSILGSTQAASLFGFRILSQSSTPLDAYSERKVSENLRVRLLLGVWGRRRLNRDQIDRLRALFRYLKAEFEIYSRKSSTPTTLALGSLITGLKLGGLG